MDCSSARSRGRMRGERKGGCDNDGAPFIGDAAGGGGRAVVGTTRWQGVGVRCKRGGWGGGADRWAPQQSQAAAV
jgi:hypothetical protein